MALFQLIRNFLFCSTLEFFKFVLLKGVQQNLSHHNYNWEGVWDNSSKLCLLRRNNKFLPK
jgi:hypothetical protein